MKTQYHVTINSFYIELKIRFQCEQYIKANITYFSKTSGMQMCIERNVKIMCSAMKHWEIFNKQLP